MSTSETLSLNFSCHCHSFSLPLTIPTTTLPLASHICHCSACRLTTGSLFGTFLILPPNLSLPLSQFSSLLKYKTRLLTRFSCPKCGAYCGDIETHAFEAAEAAETSGKGEQGEQNEGISGEWVLPVGLLDKIPAGLLERKEIYISDTVDGGGSIWFGEEALISSTTTTTGTAKGEKDGEKAGQCVKSRYLLAKTGVEAKQKDVEDMVSSAREKVTTFQNNNDKENDPNVFLKCHCHCASVSFAVQPPEQPTSPRKKYPGLLCGCTSCRVTSGMEITSWIRVPKSHLYSLHPSGSTPQQQSLPEKGKTYDPSTAQELVLYKSSPGVERYSCWKCGTSVFFINTSETRKTSVDIAAGLLDSTSTTGVRAEEWVEWCRGVDYNEDALDQRVVRALENGTEREGLREDKLVLEETWWGEKGE